MEWNDEELTCSEKEQSRLNDRLEEEREKGGKGQPLLMIADLTLKVSLRKESY